MKQHTKLLILTWLAEQLMDYTVLKMVDCHQGIWDNSTPNKILVVDANEDLRFANWNKLRWWLGDHWDPFNSIAQASGLLEATEYPYEWGRRKFVIFTQLPNLPSGVWNYACVIHPKPSAQVYVEICNTSDECKLKGDDVPLDIRCLVAIRAICKMLGVTDEDWSKIVRTDYASIAFARISTCLQKERLRHPLE